MFCMVGMLVELNVEPYRETFAWETVRQLSFAFSGKVSYEQLYSLGKAGP